MGRLLSRKRKEILEGLFTWQAVDREIGIERKNGIEASFYGEHHQGRFGEVHRPVGVFAAERQETRNIGLGQRLHPVFRIASCSATRTWPRA